MPLEHGKLSDTNTCKGMAWNEDYYVFGAWWKEEHNVQFYLNGNLPLMLSAVSLFTLA